MHLICLRRELNLLADWSGWAERGEDKNEDSEIWPATQVVGGAHLIEESGSS